MSNPFERITKSVGECCFPITPPAKIKKEEYFDKGAFPIIDQGNAFVAGYSNNEKAVCSYPPYVIFGDHTCILKYVDFPFIQGADGIKILKSKSFVDLHYLYYSLKNLRIKPKSYKRHWSWLKDSAIPICSDTTQKRIVSVLSSLDKKIALNEQLNHNLAPRLAA